MTSSGYQLLTLMAAYVGLDPGKDIEWVENDKERAVDLLGDGKIDAFLGFPPETQEVLAHKIGHSILNTTVDPPWSHYYCCMLGATSDFVERNPIAPSGWFALSSRPSISAGHNRPWLPDWLSIAASLINTTMRSRV
jgi:hypothetical protein